MTKKTAQLESFSASGAPVSQRNTVLELADGNPRLLEALDRALAVEAVDTEKVLATLRATAAEFREAVLAEALLAAQSTETSRVLACLAVCRLPVDIGTVAAVAAADVASSLDQADAVGLVEAGVDPTTGADRYRVPGLVAALVEGVLGDDERAQATAQAAKHLWSAWWERASGIDDPRALELVRLTLEASQSAHAAVIASTVANYWISQSRFVEAAALAEQVLAQVEDHRVRHVLARAQDFLGDTDAALGNYETALAVCPDDDPERPAILHNMAGLRNSQGYTDAALELYGQSLDIQERTSDARGKAATLNDMAGIRDRQGDPDAALDLYGQSLDIKERIGDARGKAITLHNMAGIRYRQGDTDAALDLYGQSLDIKERIGDAYGEAATLNDIAGIRDRQGDTDAALDLYRQSLDIQERIGNAQGKAATLNNMAAIRDRQGDTDAALDLYRQSLDIKERIGDAQGKAVTLANIGTSHFKTGDVRAAVAAMQESAAILDSIRAWPDLALVLANLGGGPVQGAAAYLAQAIWLSTIVQVDLEMAMGAAIRLLPELGRDNDGDLCLALHALARARQTVYNRQDKLISYASGPVDSCLRARNVPPEQATTWLEAKGLVDLRVITARLRRALEAFVADDQWLFDRAAIQPDRSG